MHAGHVGVEDKKVVMLTGLDSFEGGCSVPAQLHTPAFQFEQLLDGVKYQIVVLCI